jgi:hypothetical protein
MVIHSYRRVLKVRRHIHAIPWKNGQIVLDYPIPLREFTYFGILEVLFILISRLPVLGVFAHVLPYHFWFVVPFLVVYAVYISSFDGRMPHRWLQSWFAFLLRAKQTRAGLPVKRGGRFRGRQRWWVDEHAPDLHRARVSGPAVVDFNVPASVKSSLVPSLNAAVVVARPSRHAPDHQTHHVAGRMEVKS